MPSGYLRQDKGFGYSMTAVGIGDCDETKSFTQEFRFELQLG